MRPRNPEATISQTGRRVGELRRKWKLTQERFAERARISVDYVQVIEHGRANLTLYSLTRVANVLEVDVAELTRIPIRREAWPAGRPRGKKKRKKAGHQHHHPLTKPRDPDATVLQTGHRIGEFAVLADHIKGSEPWQTVFFAWLFPAGHRQSRFANLVDFVGCYLDAIGAGFRNRWLKFDHSHAQAIPAAATGG